MNPVLIVLLLVVVVLAGLKYRKVVKAASDASNASTLKDAFISSATASQATAPPATEPSSTEASATVPPVTDPSLPPAPAPVSKPFAPAPTAPTDGQKVVSLLKASAAPAASVLFGLAPMIIKGVMKRLGPKVAEKTAGKTISYTSRALAKLGVKLGKTEMARLGMKAATKFAPKVAAKASAAATQLAVQSELAADTGPGAPFVEAAFLAFDVLSMGLDLGDAGGYGKMGTKAQYIKMRDGIDAAIKKTYVENALAYPSIVGPLDKLTSDQISALVTPIISNILSVPGNKYMQPILDQMAAQSITDPVAIDAYLSTATDNIDMDAVYQEATDSLCATQGGMVMPGTDHMCSWATKASCDSSYSWPLNAANDDTYVEFKPYTGAPGGSACVTASQALRGICQTNKIPYDEVNGICRVDEKYCLSKGARWEFNNVIHDYDCTIPLGQSIAEAVFGTTITRGLDQLFNPNQFSKCLPGETDDTYFCTAVKCPGNKVAGSIMGNQVGKNSSKLMAAGLAGGPVGYGVAALGGLAKLQMCYTPCKEGYETSSFLCLEDCKPDYEDLGLSCQRIGCDDATQDHQGRLCYPKCKDGYDGKLDRCWKNCPTTGGWTDDKFTSCIKPAPSTRGVPRIPDKKPCDAGQRDDGVSCWMDDVGRGAGRMPDKAACPTGTRDDGITCWPDSYTTPSFPSWKKGTCRSQNPVVGCDGNGGLYYANCKPGYSHKTWPPLICTSNASTVSLFGRQSCRADEEMQGALCYPKCPAGYGKAGLNICTPPGGMGIRKTLMDRQYCQPGEDLSGGLCVKPCPAGTHSFGSLICSPDCPAEFKDTGLGCLKPEYSRGLGDPDLHVKIKGSYANDIGSIPDGFVSKPKHRVVPFSKK